MSSFQAEALLELPAEWRFDKDLHSPMPEADQPDARVDSFQFATTLWGMVRLAGQGDGTQAREALETLCGRYWYPLYAFARRKGRPTNDGIEEARDLTQGFFVYLLSRQLLARADESRGRFRSFLLKSFTRFMQQTPRVNGTPLPH